MYNVAIVGLGRIGSLLEDDILREKPASHAAAVSLHEETKIIAACDIDATKRLLFQKRWGVSSLYSDYKELFSKERIDILIVATDVGSHHNIVCDAARVDGISVIICEKPISNSLKHASSMIAECSEHNTLLVINHERRFSSDYCFVKDMIKEGSIGDLVSIRGSVTTMESYSSLEDGGVLMHDGTHLVDLFRFFTGSEAKLALASITPSLGYVLSGVIRMDSGVLCLVESGSCRDYFSFFLELNGTLGKIYIGNGILRYFKSKESAFYEGFRDLVELDFPSFVYTPQLFNEIDAVVDYLDNGNTVSSLGYDGYKAIEIIYALYYSAIKNTFVSLPLDHSVIGYEDFPSLLGKSIEL